MNYPTNHWIVSPAVVLLSSIALPAFGSTVCDGNQCEYDSLAKAVQDAASGDTLIIEDDYIEASGIVIDKDLTIVGLSGRRQRTIVDGQANDSVFVVETPPGGSPPEVTLSYFIVQNGDSDFGAGVHVLDGTLTTEKMIFRDNRADAGGAIALDEGASLVSAGTLYDDNLGRDGGAIDCDGCDSVWLSHDHFVDNAASSFGGAALVSDAALLRIDDTVFESNSAHSGGAVHARDTLDVRVRRTQFERNDSNYVAGSGDGGALMISNTEPTVTRASIAFSSFVENDASGGGAGGALALAVGGLGQSIEVDIWNTTFSRNRATVGGALFTGAPIIPTVNNVTLFENSANLPVGGTFAGRLILNNSILVRSSTPTGNAQDPCDPMLTVLTTWGGNLVDDPQESCGLDHDPASGVDPVARRIRDTSVHTLDASSNAVGAGVADCPHPSANHRLYQDQTRFARPNGTTSVCDVGAYEVR